MKDLAHLLFRFSIVVPFLLTLPSPSRALTTPDSTSKQSDSISNLGRLTAPALRRIRENLGILAKNIETANSNLAITAKNKLTVSEELDDLERLEKEHKALQKKYSAYLQTSEEEEKKNEEALQKLEAWERNHSDQKDSTEYKAKADAVRKEKVMRGQWKTKYEAKISALNSQMNDLLTNLQDIKSRQAPLQNELSDWVTRENEYKAAIKEMTAKRTELEKIVKK